MTVEFDTYLNLKVMERNTLKFYDGLYADYKKFEDDYHVQHGIFFIEFTSYLTRVLNKSTDYGVLESCFILYRTLFKDVKANVTSAYATECLFRTLLRFVIYMQGWSISDRTMLEYFERNVW